MMHKVKYYVETPTDALRIFSCLEDAHDYLYENDVDPSDTHWDDYNRAGDVLIRVPAFAEAIERYTAAKAVACARWGCE
jgi:hypothetical protein